MTALGLNTNGGALMLPLLPLLAQKERNSNTTQRNATSAKHQRQSACLFDVHNLGLLEVRDTLCFHTTTTLKTSLA